MSPSSRRAWVEMACWKNDRLEPKVALLAEGVGRNPKRHGAIHFSRKVALLAEGVGRNETMLTRFLKMQSRPPRGGRG